MESKRYLVSVLVLLVGYAALAMLHYRDSSRQYEALIKLNEAVRVVNQRTLEHESAISHLISADLEEFAEKNGIEFLHVQ